MPQLQSYNPISASTQRPLDRSMAVHSHQRPVTEETISTSFSLEGTHSMSTTDDRSAIDLGDEHEAAPQPRKGFRLHDRREQKVAGMSGGIGTILGVVLVSLITMMFGGSSDQNDGQKIAANASDTNQSSSLSDAQKESDQKTDDQGTPEPKTIIPEPEPKTPVRVASAKTQKQPVTKTDEPVEKAAEVLAEISLSGTEYTKFVSFKIIKGDKTQMGAIARELASIGGVKHENAGTEGDLVIFSRESKPAQTVTKITVTAKGITVVFREDPTPEQLKTVQKTLVTAANDLGIRVGESSEGEGTSRTFAAVAKTKK